MIDRMHEQLPPLLERLRLEKPLVHHITNKVVTNFTANGTLAIGASPVMASDPEEVVEMVAHAQVLVLNLGTLTVDNARSMQRAGKRANQLGIPVIMDPVGYGTTSFRNRTVDALIRDVRISLVRGNAAEIAALCQVPWEQKGVDAIQTSSEDRIQLAQRFVSTYHIPVAITGPVDIVSDQTRTVAIENGHSLLPFVTGSGCLVTAIIAAYRAVCADDLLAAVAGLCTVGIAGEQAAELARGPGELSWRLMDSLYCLTAETLEKNVKITVVKG